MSREVLKFNKIGKIVKLFAVVVINVSHEKNRYKDK